VTLAASVVIGIVVVERVVVEGLLSVVVGAIKTVKKNKKSKQIIIK